MHQAHAARDTETSRVTPAEHPVLLQIPAPSLRSKGLLALHGEDTAQAYCPRYPVLNAVGKGWKCIAKEQR